MNTDPLTIEEFARYIELADQLQYDKVLKGMDLVEYAQLYMRIYENAQDGET